MKRTTIPLFPLNTVLFPDGVLALQIFELRYLDMIRACIANDSSFGVLPLVSGSETQLPGQILSTCGTLATVIEWQAPQAALLKINCRGGARFRTHAHTQQKNGLWTAQVEILNDDHIVAIPAELQNTADMLDGLIAALQSNTLRLDQPVIAAPFRQQECGWVANRWCEVLPLSAQEKVRLLMLDNPLLRLELMQDMLEQRQILPSHTMRPLH